MEAAGVSLASNQYAVDYARTCLRIGRESYQEIWYRLHTATDVGKWRNVLALSELIFSLLFSSGQVERMFFMMKIIKADRRTSMHTSILLDLLEIQVEGQPLTSFFPDRAVKPWCEDCKTWKVNKAPRRVYRPRAASTESS